MPCRHILLISSLACAATLLTQLPAYAQTASTSAPPTSMGTAGPAWEILTKPQQTALLPLAHPWNNLSEGQRRKWLAIAKTYPDLTPAEQEKMHSRMVDWANLPAKDREQARLNFAQSKTVNQTDRSAHWEAYQALSPEERKKLADSAKTKSVGAAVAVKPVHPDKLAAVPVTRHTPEPERAHAASLHPLNRNTLLPQAVAKPASASASSSAGAARP